MNPKLGYLCSEYPALSHTFISREIDVLERQGFLIFTASINPTKSPEKLDPPDQARAATTYYIKLTPKPRILATLCRYLLRLSCFFPTLSFCLRLDRSAGGSGRVKALGYFLQAILLHDWARRNGIAHIHVHFANPAATVALVATKFGGLEFSLSVHGPDEFYDVTRNNIREKLQSAVFVRCIGNFCRSQLMRLVPMEQWGKFRVVRCGLYPGEFAPRTAQGGPARNVVCVGRVCPSKGQAVLVESAVILRSRGLDFHILFLGGGEDLAAVRRRVEELGLSDFVSLAGPVAHSSVKEELAKADLFVLPSFAEGIPVALMEAMASGVPVVSTCIAGIPELIESGKDGILTDASDSLQLADAIEAFLEGRVDTGAMLASAARKVSAEYDVEKNTLELGKIFAQVLR